MQRLALALGRRLLRHRARRRARQFERLAGDCAATQRSVLARLLRLNAGTRFQRDFGISPRLSADEFRRQMPLTTFADAAPYVEDVKRGDAQALCGRGNRILMFALTSGTVGDAKFVPITRRFLKDYRRGWTVWGYHALTRHHLLPDQSFLQIVSDFDRFRTPCGLACGNISGLVQHMQSRFIRRKFVVPAAAMSIPEAAAKSYLALRLGLADRNVGLITTANPSTLVILAKQADAEREALIRDIHDGSLSTHHDIPNGVRRAVAASVSRPDRARARELEKILHTCGHLHPRDYWPRASLIAVWTGGSAAAYLPSVRRLYGDVPIRDHGLSASEGRMTIPLEDETAAGLLDVGSHFFEFIPQEQADTDAPETLLAHELEVGRCYFIVLTTASGLYRYNIHDVVRCTGFNGTAPVLEFLHKGSHIANVTGEKLTESQVVQAVSAACARLEIQLGHSTLCPVWGDPPGYQLLLEGCDLPSLDAADRLAATVEELLQHSNCEYRDKRATGRLAPLTCELLAAGTWTRYIARQQSRPGGSLEQYKHPCLTPDLAFRDEVLSLGDNQTAMDMGGPAPRPGREATGRLTPGLQAPKTPSSAE